MEAHKLETEFSLYWSKLTIVQKESILEVVKHIVNPVEYDEKITIPDEHWALLMKEREEHYAGAKSYSWDEVKAMARNKESRDGLRS